MNQPPAATNRREGSWKTVTMLFVKVPKQGDPQVAQDDKNYRPEAATD